MAEATSSCGEEVILLHVLEGGVLQGTEGSAGSATASLAGRGAEDFGYDPDDSDGAYLSKAGSCSLAGTDANAGDKIRAR